ncbi:hypothetical protein KFL_001340260 [Klebsormidium nitens]|uniref:C3H1-type domain-containing protein n=1 Tax=Klebsormidium nitens TaxID=105231 RepID=A0A1Y1I1L9_KLENI|nr:hypothetical protein KFL_001340260 [Klebsormidium nitens]|eukprot:GAQ83071.1 hypothetical protein KFL_001340260 [Klebsormidium nitens]
MPVPKYHCDYCDVTFRDSREQRKRHQEGFNHRRNKKAWFDNIEGGVETREVCRNFVRQGFCTYGDRCKYHHPAQQPQEVQLVQAAPIDATNVWHGSQSDLPPSLQPPPPGGWPASAFTADWG